MQLLRIAMKNKFLIAIYTHKKTFYYRKFLLDYYANTLKYPVYFITGDKDIKHDNMLYINFNESYDQLGLKTYLTFKRLNKLRFDYLIKLNDDTLFNIDRLLKIDISAYDYIGKIENQNKESSTSHFFKCSKAFKIPKRSNEVEYVEGGFVVLSRKAFNQVLKVPKKYFLNSPENYSGEDQKIGKILHKARKLNLNSKFSKYLNMDIAGEGISFHPVHESLTEQLIDKTFEEQLNIFSKNSHKNEYNISELLYGNNTSARHSFD